MKLSWFKESWYTNLIQIKWVSIFLERRSNKRPCPQLVSRSKNYPLIYVGQHEPTESQILYIPIHRISSYYYTLLIFPVIELVHKNPSFSDILVLIPGAVFHCKTCDTSYSVSFRNSSLLLMVHWHKDDARPKINRTLLALFLDRFGTHEFS